MPQAFLFDNQSSSGAEFSPGRTWRYMLWRRWAAGGNMVMFVGLNPSTADEEVNDPTIRRCIGFAKFWGFSGLFMANAYGLRSTDPSVLTTVDDPVGEGNDAAIAARLSEASLVVAAWGTHCSRERTLAMRALLASSETVYCLGRNRDGSPKHPLYLPRDAARQVYWERSAA